MTTYILLREKLSSSLPSKHPAAARSLFWVLFFNNWPEPSDARHVNLFSVSRYFNVTTHWLLAAQSGPSASQPRKGKTVTLRPRRTTFDAPDATGLNNDDLSKSAKNKIFVGDLTASVQLRGRLVNMWQVQIDSALMFTLSRGHVRPRVTEAHPGEPAGGSRPDARGHIARDFGCFSLSSLGLFDGALGVGRGDVFIWQQAKNVLCFSSQFVSLAPALDPAKAFAPLLPLFQR